MTVRVGELVRVRMEKDEADGQTYPIARNVHGEDVTAELQDRHLLPVVTGDVKEIIYRRTDRQWRKEESAREFAKAAQQAEKDSARAATVMAAVSPAVRTGPTRDDTEETEEDSSNFDSEISAEESPDDDWVDRVQGWFTEPTEDLSDDEPWDSDKVDEAVAQIMEKAESLKPADIFLPPLIWRVLVRNAVRGTPTILVGEKGTGKSKIVETLARVLGRHDKFVEIPLNAAQDARATLVGTTHFKRDQGTYVSKSAFIRAIEQRDSFINLDEVTRANKDAQNLLLQATNPGQGYLRLDEAPGAPKIRVARGVVFFGTSNIGSKYTALTKTDAALVDRFMLIEIPQLDVENETQIIAQRYPKLDSQMCRVLAEISTATRDDANSETPTLSLGISTRQVLEIAGLLNDGFLLSEAAELAIYPIFNKAGGTESEQTHARQLVQRYLVDEPTPAAATNTAPLPWSNP